MGASERNREARHRSEQSDPAFGNRKIDKRVHCLNSEAERGISITELTKMNYEQNRRRSERGGAGIKFLLMFVVLALIANAGWNYIPIAYNGASFKQEMDTAVVKALGASGQMKPLDIATATIQKAAYDNDIPSTALIEIKPVNGVVVAHATYTQPVNMLPFGIWTYNYTFEHEARPVGYLTKGAK